MNITDANAILFDGFADETTRAQLFAAVDLVVVSVKAGALTDSGNLMDAIASGRSVVCSDRCPSAAVTSRYGLGSLFESGNAEDLVAAVRNVRLEIDPACLRDARRHFSGVRIAQMHVDALSGSPGYEDSSVRPSV